MKDQLEKYKPLGINNYGTIPLLPNSRVTPSDKHCHEGQARIATLKVRDRHDEITLSEKLDGSNCGICLLNGEIIALGRAGYLAETSPYEQHKMFAKWVKINESRFRYVLKEGERICGEWLAQAHGTRYNLQHEPFVVFDIMKQHERLGYNEFCKRVSLGNFIVPKLLHRGGSISVENALNLLTKYGWHGAIDEVEGCVWRVERKGQVDFLCKYLKPYKVDGIYLPEISGKEAVWNWRLNKDGE
jgi:hypothetical protein